MSSRSLAERLLRGLRPALLGPLRFSIDSGHLRSSMLGQPVDRSGVPLPWITYPAIEFLRGLEWRGRRVLEWGAGYSTLWWANQGARVLAIEHSQAWVGTVRARLAAAGDGINDPGANVEVRWARDPLEYVRAPLADGPFDLAVIDGVERYRCAESALQLTAPTGAILLDNSEQPWTEPGQSGFPIVELLRARGWRRVDFHGFAPSVARPHCTSLFFRPETTILDSPRPPIRPPGIVPG